MHTLRKLIMITNAYIPICIVQINASRHRNTHTHNSNCLVLSHDNHLYVYSLPHSFLTTFSVNLIALAMVFDHKRNIFIYICLRTMKDSLRINWHWESQHFIYDCIRVCFRNFSFAYFKFRFLPSPYPPPSVISHLAIDHWLNIRSKQ